MQTYDFLMIAVLAAATLFGFWKGLAWQIASLASLVASYFVALRFADQLAPSISQHAPWNKFLAMLIIYAATSFFIWMAFRVVAGMIDRVKLREFDRQMGALVGFGKGVLLCIAITFFAVSLLEAHRDRIIASRSGQTIVQILAKAEAVTPPEIHRVISPYIDRVNQRLDPNYQPNPAGDLNQIKELWERQARRSQGVPAASAPSNFGGWPQTPLYDNGTPAQPISTYPPGQPVAPPRR